MTNDEFVSKKSAWKSYRDRLSVFWLAGFSIFFAWSYLAAGKIDMHWTSPLWQVCFIAYLVGGVIAIFWLSSRRMRRLGMFCPRCGQGKLFLFNASSTRHILTTGKCRCGHEIIESR